MPKYQKLSELEQRRERTLNVRFPYVIKDKKDVENLFEGNFHVKLPRQSSRACRVVFGSMEEKIKNYNITAAKGRMVNGKRIIIQSLNVLTSSEKTTKKIKKKKVYMSKIISNKCDSLNVIPKMTRTIFISNIANGIKSHEIKSVLPGCILVTLLKSYNKHFRSAIAKMENTQIAIEYLKKKHKWPVLRGHKVFIKPDTRVKHKKRVSTSTLKIYDANTTEECKSDESSDCENND